ncbi:prohibitin family protein [Beggiatoa leptomitoformis]|uniref:Prohibitin family protein n=1 Tax=Beggiatoa leptomitoformis TaxID=288004 RepID=A0A2N9YBF0_9GAMM|nr:prohibitin family protein [Beggiatoa leptomitoformis]ALG69298.2 prohibitin family protein [Beggiatoa leptomitoformis]AUI67801.1 prohibitin family protein [Beggiatoa leptomitoformis]
MTTDTLSVNNDSTVIEQTIVASPKPSRRFITRLADWVYDNILYFIVFPLVIIGLIVLVWTRIFVVVHSGEAGVLYRLFTSGTVTNYVYPEGLQVINPFNTMTIYNVRVQILLHDFEVLTNRGLPITLRLAIRFRPIYELIGVLHKEVGPDYPNKIILPQIESVLRKRIGKLTPEDVYTNKAGVLNEIIAQAIEEVGQKFVIIDEIIIRTVALPPAVKSAVDAKLVNEQQYLAYDFILKREEQEAERKRIEATGMRDFQKIVSETLNQQILEWHGIQATLDLAKSDNAKVVVIGKGDNGLPLILGLDDKTPSVATDAKSSDDVKK